MITGPSISVLITFIAYGVFSRRGVEDSLRGISFVSEGSKGRGGSLASLRIAGYLLTRGLTLRRKGNFFDSVLLSKNLTQRGRGLAEFCYYLFRGQRARWLARCASHCRLPFADVRLTQRRKGKFLCFCDSVPLSKNLTRRTHGDPTG